MAQTWAISASCSKAFIFAPFLLVPPTAPKLPYIGIGRIVPSPPTQPVIGPAHHQRREDRHANEKITEVATYNNAATMTFCCRANVTFWPLADMGWCTANVRFGGQIRHHSLHCKCPLMTQIGRHKQKIKLRLMIHLRRQHVLKLL
jgi:hypothetical protein